MVEKLYLQTGQTFSSSKILNDNFDLFDKPQNQFLKKIKKNLI